MDKKSFIKKLEDSRIICVLRTSLDRDLRPVIDALVAGGINLIELTTTCPSFLDRLGIYVEHAKSHNAIFGVGTVLDVATAIDSIHLGSSFVVSPIFNPDIVSACRDLDVPVIPGCMTPTEIFNAWNAGATIIKTFPGRVCVPGFFKDLAGPFPDIRMMPTGNVNENTAVEYIEAGAIAVGVGKALVSDDLISAGAWDIITSQARRFNEIVHGASSKELST